MKSLTDAGVLAFLRPCGIEMNFNVTLTSIQFSDTCHHTKSVHKHRMYANIKGAFIIGMSNAELFLSIKNLYSGARVLSLNSNINFHPAQLRGV